MAVNGKKKQNKKQQQQQQQHKNGSREVENEIFNLVLP